MVSSFDTLALEARAGRDWLERLGRSIEEIKIEIKIDKDYAICVVVIEACTNPCVKRISALVRRVTNMAHLCFEVGMSYDIRYLPKAVVSMRKSDPPWIRTAASTTTICPPWSCVITVFFSDLRIRALLH